MQEDYPFPGDTNLAVIKDLRGRIDLGDLIN